MVTFQEIELNRFASSNKKVFIDADSMLYYSTLNKEEIASLTHLKEEAFNTEAFELMKSKFLLLNQNIKEACNSGGEYKLFFSCDRLCNYRLFFDSSYKLTRTKQPKPPLLKELKLFLLTNYSNTFQCLNCEADDIVAYYKHLYLDDCIIASPDKDVLMQLPGIHFNYQKQTLIHTDKLTAEKFLFFQMIAGDPVDGIKGLPNVGPIKAKKLLDKLGYSYNSVVSLYKEFNCLDKLVSTAYLVDISMVEEVAYSNLGQSIAIIRFANKYL